MIIYCDTSALYKKYAEEAGAACVREILASAEYVLTSIFTELELTSATERSKRDGHLDSPTYRAVTAAIARDLEHQTITLLDINQQVIREGKRIIHQRRLRAADALQCATAIVAAKAFATTPLFLCADGALLDAARLEGLRCRDVSK